MKRLGIVASLLVAVALGFGVGWALRGHPTATPSHAKIAHTVTVPNVIGLRSWEAYHRIKNAGLHLTTFFGVPRQDAPKGTIFAQQPAAGAVVPVGSMVDFTLSTGPPASG
jgi:hypothetical protein